MPRRSAVRFAAGGARRRPRPRGRSGFVRRKETSWRAASRSSTSAPNGAVAAAPRRAAAVVVAALALPRLTPENGVGVLTDLRERQPAPRFAFRIELLLDDLPVFLGHGSSLVARETFRRGAFAPYSRFEDSREIQTGG